MSARERQRKCQRDRERESFRERESVSERETERKCQRERHRQRETQGEKVSETERENFFFPTSMEYEYWSSLFYFQCLAEIISAFALGPLICN